MTILTAPLPPSVRGVLDRARAPGTLSVPHALDQIVYATPDLTATVETIREATGVMPRHGGVHRGQGTENFLLPLGDQRYLAIIGPTRTPGERPELRRPFGIDALTDGRLVSWGLRGPRIERVIAHWQALGLPVEPVRAIERHAPDGRLLRWRVAAPQPSTGTTCLPFLIEGAGFEASGPAPVTLDSFWVCSADPQRLQHALHGLADDLVVLTGPPMLKAVINTPRGEVLLS